MVAMASIFYLCYFVQLHISAVLRYWQASKSRQEAIALPSGVWHTHTHTHTRLTALFPALPRWAGTRKVKTIRILLKQETVSGSSISWAICKSAPHSRLIAMPAPQHSVFLQTRCPSCRSTNSVKALKAGVWQCTRKWMTSVDNFPWFETVIQVRDSVL